MGICPLLVALNAYPGCSLISVALADVFSGITVCYSWWWGQGRVLWDLSTSEEDTSSIRCANKTLENTKTLRPDLEAWIILDADWAVVLTCPSKLSHKLQGEEASPEGSIKQTWGSVSQALDMSDTATQNLQTIESSTFCLKIFS